MFPDVLAPQRRGMVMTEELRQELERLKNHKMSAAELDAQRVSFVYGNAPKEDKGTKESVRRSLGQVEAA